MRRRPAGLCLDDLKELEDLEDSKDLKALEDLEVSRIWVALTRSSVRGRRRIVIVVL